MRTLAVGCLFVAACQSGPSVRDEPPIRRIDMEPMQVEIVRVGADARIDSYDATSLFEEGGALLAANDFDGALARYDRLLEKFPESSYVPPTLYNAGLAHEGKNDFRGAADRYRALVERFGDTADARDGLFRLGGVLAELRDWQASADVFGRVLAGTDLSFADHIEALSRKGLAHHELGDLDGTESAMRQAIDLYKKESALERLDSLFFVGMAYYYAAASSHARCTQIPIRLPEAQMSKDLNEKARLLLQAQDEYVATIRLRDPHWATAAGYQVGAMYTEFHDQILAAPIPPELNDEAKEIYVEELRKTVRPLIEKAIGVFEKTVLMAERVGVRNDWVKRTSEQLDTLRRLLTGEEHGDTPEPVLPPAPDRKPGRIPSEQTPPVVL
jgi:tetratricopeptide (TPR) repeat protein